MAIGGTVGFFMGNLLFVFFGIQATVFDDVDANVDDAVCWDGVAACI